MSRRRPSRNLTSAQLRWIRAIPVEWITQHALLNLRGNAKQYYDSHRDSLRSAIDRCNNRSAPNSPLRDTQRIETGRFSPKGELGYRLIDTEPLVTLAFEVSQ